MLANIRKFLSATAKKKILDSVPYRLLRRAQLSRHQIRFSCELTTRCNAHCDICTRDSSLEEKQLYVGDMDRELTGRIIQEIKKFHDYGSRIYFEPMGLGEPLLYNGLFDLFRKVKNISKKINIVLVTNGILLDQACSKKLISLSIDEVSISLNAVNALGYHQHMNVNAYDKVLRNIENLISLRNKSGNRLPSVFVQYIDYDNNQTLFQEKIKGWLKIMRYYDKCYVHPVVNQAGFFGGVDTSSSSAARHPCSQPLWRVAIKVNGDIYPCCSCFYSGAKKISSLYLGNIRTESPFTLFSRTNSKRLKIMESMRKDDYSRLPECARCDVKEKLECNCYFALPGALKIKGYKWL